VPSLSASGSARVLRLEHHLEHPAHSGSANEPAVDRHLAVVRQTGHEEPFMGWSLAAYVTAWRPHTVSRRPASIVTPVPNFYAAQSRLRESGTDHAGCAVSGLA
jgi:hypothetical protein